MNDEVLKVEGVVAGYGRVKVLDHVSLDLTRKEITVLLGANGSGKSTLIKCIVGAVRPERGSIVLMHDGHPVDITNITTSRIVEQGISLVPEGRGIFPTLTVRENLLMGAYSKIARPSLADNLKAIYEVFPRLEDRGHQEAGTMSGGEQQMLGIARALMSNPKILLLDEPSLGLAPALVQKVMSTVRELVRSREITILMAEQNFTQAVKIADRGYVMVNGKIALQGDSNSLAKEQFIKDYYLGGSLPEK